MDDIQKTALVTGANRGIGLEVSRQLLARGFRVFVGVRDPDAGREALARLNSPSAEVMEIDVSDLESVRRAARAFAERAGRLDVLVNNAGVLLPGDLDILKLDPGLFPKTFQTNVFGAFYAIQTFAPLLLKSTQPRVINVSSGGGQLNEPSWWAPAYCASKTALNAVTVQFAAGMPQAAVNSVCPGWTRTDMGGSMATRSVEEGADTIVWLATEADPAITGRFLRDRQPISW